MSSTQRHRATFAACAAALAFAAASASAQWSGHMGSGPGTVGTDLNAARVMGGGMSAFGNDLGLGMTGPGFRTGAADGSMMTGALMGGGLFGDLEWGLNLTPEQRTQVATLLRDFRRARWDAMGDIMDEAAHLQQLLAASVPDLAAVTASRERLAQLRAQQLEAELALRARIEALLTPEQRDRLQILRGCR